ncbi:SdiA-regulated domain-containing protein [Neolewinella agarilytica]|uniref:SdiA-regulated n=1 Tax=Neolewinella agarilytica TaxID=478744 RepID=A0A1H9N6Q6_9BACT|nr:SdiA-regulated domain-containing protein [Neolewinella agarilytica]SER31592.1 SdiA-regulated [Neolewinella agarilytica]
MIKFLFSLFLLSSTLSTAQQATMVYDLSSPDLLGEMPKELAEISGLSLAGQKVNELLAIQDESGKVFRLSARTGKMISSITFWKDGDYEGVEAVGDDIWVLKSTGTLYQVMNIGLPSQQVEKYNTALTGDNDVEGLTYDPTQNRLLLACKKDASNDGNSKNGRYIFSFDLATKTLAEKPVYAIEREAVQNYLLSCEKSTSHKKLCDFFLARDEFDLAPSAIAIHPITGQLYITSSVGKVLMVLNTNGTIDGLYKLEKDFFPQPEGLAFDPDGTLYISTEAKKKAPARIYRLAYRSK